MKTPQSIKQLAAELSVDPRTLRRRLAKVKPVGFSHGGPTYTLDQARRAMVKEPLRQRGSEAEQVGRAMLLAETIRKVRLANDSVMARMISADLVKRQNAKLRELFAALKPRLVAMADEFAARHGVSREVAATILACVHQQLSDATGGFNPDAL